MIQLGIIGGGIMAEAIASRLLAQNYFAPEAVLVSEPVLERQNFWVNQYGVKVTGNNLEAAAAPILLLAVKPQIFSAIAQDLQHHQNCPTEQLVLSILAGISLAQLDAAFPSQSLVRVMPNTPALVGSAMTVFARGTRVTPQQLEQVNSIFAAIGEVSEVPESLMDAVTGLSGSGPAYVALLVEALADGGVAAGLPRALALKLALQTVRGTTELLHQTGQHPALLKDQVCSPGGTTIAGVSVLEEKGLRSALISAVKAASQRSRELGNANRKT